jgi:hypothetical protein
MTPGYGKIWEASEVWGGLAAVAFLAGVSGYMLWTALRGVPARLSARAQRYTIVALSVLWIGCLLASFTVVNMVDALAPTVWLILVLCPLCILVLPAVKE